MTVVRAHKALAAAAVAMTVLGSTSCAQNQPTQEVRAERPLLTASGVPPYRILAPSGATSLLISSLHQAADGLRQPSAAVFGGATQYVVEGVASSVETKTPETAQEVLQGRSLRASWAAFLTPGQIAEARRRAHCIDRLASLPPAMVDTFVELTLRYASAQHFAGVAIYRYGSPGLRSRDALLAEAAAGCAARSAPAARWVRTT